MVDRHLFWCGLVRLKAEDYADEVGVEVGSPLAAEVSDIEFGGANLEATVEGEGTRWIVLVPMLPIHPRRFQRFSLLT